VLVYSTYLGGTLAVGGDDVGVAVTVDGTGSAYVTGYTYSSDFPTTGGATWNAGSDAFVTKLAPTGAALLYSTFLGGSGEDSGQGIAVDAAGSAYVTGSTSSSDFPTTAGAHDMDWNGDRDAFVTKLNLTGAAPLVYSTYLGGTDEDRGQGIAVDGVGNAYVTGVTYSIDFPTTAAYDTSHNGSYDAFVTKIGDVSAPATLAISPAADTNTAGQEHCVTATVQDAFGNPVPPVTVRFSVTGANSFSGLAATDINGEASFCYTGTTAGLDTISGYADTNNDGVQDTGEPDGTATKTWVLPPAAPGCATARGLGSIRMANRWAAFVFHVGQKPSKPAPRGLLL
jgi:hypothetical protein